MSTHEDTKKAQARARARIAVELERQGVDPSPANVEATINAFASATGIAITAFTTMARTIVDMSLAAGRLQLELDEHARAVTP